MQKHSAEDHHKMVELVTAVLEDGEDLIFETLVIRTGWGRKPKTITAEGVHFGLSTPGTPSGYIMQGVGGPRIAEDIQFPKRHSQMQVSHDIDGYLYWLTDDVAPNNAQGVITKAMYAIAELLPDGHPLRQEYRAPLSAKD